MPLLFSYGTLQQADVQLAAFGRLLEGEQDELPGFKRSLVAITDSRVVAETGMTHYANVTFSGEQDSRVGGTVYEITEAELLAVDEYEQDAAYKRILVVLTSGKEAWVYFN
jgi:gamma-glutamylcyclotransferase (GGCT)/AIG2-like uncharacterized protein YtfP